MNEVSFAHVSIAEAVELLDGWSGSGLPTTQLHVQVATARVRRLMVMNGRPIMLAGVNLVAGASYEGWLVIDPDWSPPPKGFIRIVRQLRKACADLAPLHVCVRSEAGRRLAISCRFGLARTIRLNGEILEVWHVVAEKNVPRNFGCAVAAQTGGSASGCSAA